MKLGWIFGFCSLTCLMSMLISLLRSLTSCLIYQTSGQWPESRKKEVIVQTAQWEFPVKPHMYSQTPSQNLHMSDWVLSGFWVHHPVFLVSLQNLWPLGQAFTFPSWWDEKEFLQNLRCLSGTGRMDQSFEDWKDGVEIYCLLIQIMIYWKIQKSSCTAE